MIFFHFKHKIPAPTSTGQLPERNTEIYLIIDDISQVIPMMISVCPRPFLKAPKGPLANRELIHPIHPIQPSQHTNHSHHSLALPCLTISYVPSGGRAQHHIGSYRGLIIVRQRSPPTSCRHHSVGIPEVPTQRLLGWDYSSPSNLLYEVDGDVFIP